MSGALIFRSNWTADVCESLRCLKMYGEEQKALQKAFCFGYFIIYFFICCIACAVLLCLKFLVNARVAI